MSNGLMILVLLGVVVTSTLAAVVEKAEGASSWQPRKRTLVHIQSTELQGAAAGTEVAEQLNPRETPLALLGDNLHRVRVSSVRLSLEVSSWRGNFSVSFFVTSACRCTGYPASTPNPLCSAEASARASLGEDVPCDNIGAHGGAYRFARFNIELTNGAIISKGFGRCFQDFCEFSLGDLLDGSARRKWYLTAEIGPQENQEETAGHNKMWETTSLNGFVHVDTDDVCTGCHNQYHIVNNVTSPRLCANSEDTCIGGNGTVQNCEEVCKTSPWDTPLTEGGDIKLPKDNSGTPSPYTATPLSTKTHVPTAINLDLRIEQPQKEDMAEGEKIGIAVGAMLVSLAVVMLMVVMCLRYKRDKSLLFWRRRAQQPEAPEVEPVDVDLLVAKLPTSTDQELGQQEDAASIQCCVCLNTLAAQRNNEPVVASPKSEKSFDNEVGPWVLLSCNHLLHLDCLRQWLENRVSKQLSLTCPVCRHVVGEEKESEPIV